jgi:CDP-glucose 4,6-dehydratase
MMLAMNGHKVYGYALDPLEEGIFSAANVSAEIERDISGDIRDISALNKAFRLANPDLVIHMAAQPLVRTSYLNPVETFEVNVTGTLNVLEATRSATSIKGVAVITTDKVYRNLEERKPFRELDPLGPSDPYSTSKAMADLLAQTWSRNVSDFPIAIFRAGNVIGGGDVSENRLIPDIVRAQSLNKAPTLRHPESVRPWQHVLDCLTGYCMAIEWMLDKQESVILNFGPTPNEYMTVGEVASKFISISQTKLWEKVKSEEMPETSFLALDSQKARDLLGWQNKYTLDQSLEATQDWYREQKTGSNMNKITKEHVKFHESFGSDR